MFIQCTLRPIINRILRLPTADIIYNAIGDDEVWHLQSQTRVVDCGR